MDQPEDCRKHPSASCSNSEGKTRSSTVHALHPGQIVPFCFFPVGAKCEPSVIYDFLHVLGRPAALRTQTNIRQNELGEQQQHSSRVHSAHKSGADRETGLKIKTDNKMLFIDKVMSFMGVLSASLWASLPFSLHLFVHKSLRRPPFSQR